MPNYNGSRVAGSSSTIHTGAGRLLGYLISHSETTTQSVSFYDNTTARGTILHKVNVAAEQSPFFVRFEDAFYFNTGLTVNPGNCEVSVWASGR
jgi:hypothetical protein